MHQSNGITERSNRSIVEGANCAIYAAAFDSKWWVCAAAYWVTMYNATVVGADGLTPWQRRFGQDPELQIYPWGALAFVKPPADLTRKKDRFHAKLQPHLLVGIGIGPGGIWDKTYAVVPLNKLLGQDRQSRVYIKRTPDVTFPEVPSFPLRLRLTASGALGHATLPAPAVAVDGADWQLQDGGDDSTDDEPTDGLLGENRPRMVDKYAEAVALDPEAHDDDEDVFLRAHLGK